VRDDCAQRLDELERAQPTVVFDARDGSGNDFTEVTVTLDGRPLAIRLDGHALAVDPGEHTFLFQVAGQPAVSRTFVLKEGEKDRRERIVVGPAVVTPVPQQPAVVPATTPVTAPALPTATTDQRAWTVEPNAPSSEVGTTHASEGMNTRKVVGITMASIGVAGIAMGTVFGFIAMSAWNNSRNECRAATDCSSHAQAVNDHSATLTDGTISTIAFVGGGVLAVAGAVLFFTAPPTYSSSSSPVVIRIAATIGPTIAGSVVQGTF
jgi:hypothetical protein